MELLPENDLAVELYNQIKALGAETVFRLTTLDLSRSEAEELLNKMALIASVVGEWERQQRES